VRFVPPDIVLHTKLQGYAGPGTCANSRTPTATAARSRWGTGRSPCSTA
jgi:hypothetical protein